MIIKIRNPIIRRPPPPRDDAVNKWAEWQGGDFLHVYTDGSHATDRTLTQYLLGTCNRKVGGAIVLSDGVSWVHRIFVAGA